MTRLATPAPLDEYEFVPYAEDPDHGQCPLCGEDGTARTDVEAYNAALRATPAPLDCGHDLVGIRLRGYREGRAEALGDVREFVDESHDRAVAYAKETT